MFGKFLQPPLDVSVIAAAIHNQPLAELLLPVLIFLKHWNEKIVAPGPIHFLIIGLFFLLAVFSVCYWILLHI